MLSDGAARGAMFWLWSLPTTSAKSKPTERVVRRFRFLRHFHLHQPVSLPGGHAVRHSCSVDLAGPLADAGPARGLEFVLSGALLSEPGDLHDYPARLKAAIILEILRQKVRRVRESHGAPSTRKRMVDRSASRSSVAHPCKRQQHCGLVAGPQPLRQICQSLRDRRHRPTQVLEFDMRF